MRKIITIIFISLSTIGFSQNSSGIITYEETTNLQIDMAQLEEQGMAEYASMIPTSNSTKKQLLFTKKLTLYSNLKEENKKGNNQVIMMSSNSNGITHIDLLNNKTTEQKDFMGKTFLIDGKLEKIKWKITGDTKIIMNYPCIKAVLNDSNETIEAWFTAELPISIGPEKYGQLPGIILELSSKMLRKTIIAVDLKYRNIGTNELEKPTEGKKVTKKQYDEIVEKKIKDIALEYGGGKIKNGTSIQVIRQ